MPKDIIMKFVKAINEQDLSLIIDMMSEDFTFIDTHGINENKQANDQWMETYFDWFPDYLIEVHDYLEGDNFSMIIGEASASYLGNKEKAWDFPACWKVVVNKNQIELWQVFCDSKKQFDSME